MIWSIFLYNEINKNRVFSSENYKNSMNRWYFYLATLAVVIPGILISEPPKVEPITLNKPPVEILFSGVTSMNTGAAVFLKIDGNQNVYSSCESTSSKINNNDSSSIIQWQPVGACTVPMIRVADKNYLLPINGHYPDESMLSDISSETLKNTLRASTVLRSDYRLSSLRVREFFDTIDDILRARDAKFTLPIKGAKLPTQASHLPNSPRPFRAESTDGVHHGFDFYTSEWTPVQAIEDGTIIHVKRDFSWNEMNHLHTGDSELEEQENLDVYRGNTVYLKTRSGHVAIYAHLQKIPDNIQEWQTVTKGQIVWHVGDSAVPDKKYLYHLHFELAMNPFIDERAGSYDFEDVLLWPFWWKGKSAEWIRTHDVGLFE